MTDLQDEALPYPLIIQAFEAWAEAAQTESARLCCWLVWSPMFEHIDTSSVDNAIASINRLTHCPVTGTTATDEWKDELRRAAESHRTLVPGRRYSVGMRAGYVPEVGNG